MKTQKLVFGAATEALTIIVLMFAANSIFNDAILAERFSRLGYSSYIIFPLVGANVLGLIIIWTGSSKVLSEWAYAGFLFNFVLAFLTELRAEDGDIISSLLALLFLIGSYYSRNKRLVTLEPPQGKLKIEVPVAK